MINNPVSLVIGITNQCNLSCKFCFNGKHAIKYSNSIKRGVMSLATFKEILCQAKGFVSHIELGLFGEPTIHPYFIEMVTLAVNEGFSVGVYSNGTLLNSEISQQLLQTGLTSITISVDGMTDDEYEQIRSGGRYHIVEDNLKFLLAYRKKIKKNLPLIGIRSVLFSDTLDQKKIKRRFVDRLGVDFISFAPLDNWNGTVNINNDSTSFTITENRYSFNRCEFPWMVLSVNWNGDILPCCDDYMGKNILGNVNKQNLQSIWNGKQLKTIRLALKSRSFNQIIKNTGCASCSMLHRKSIPKKLEFNLILVALRETWKRLLDA